MLPEPVRTMSPTLPPLTVAPPPETASSEMTAPFSTVSIPFFTVASATVAVPTRALPEPVSCRSSMVPPLMMAPPLVTVRSVSSAPSSTFRNPPATRTSSALPEPSIRARAEPVTSRYATLPPLITLTPSEAESSVILPPSSTVRYPP